MDITKPTQLKLVAELTRSISSKMNGTFHIVKKMSGANLSVRCYPNSQGIDIGSCSNVDICSEFMMMVNASKDYCPQNLIDNGIDCSCPMKLDRTRLNIDLPLVVYPSAVTESWFFGELNIELNVQEQGETLFCLNVDLDVKTFLWFSIILFIFLSIILSQINFYSFFKYYFKYYIK